MSERVPERAVETALREVGDAYVRDHPVDLEQARLRVEAHGRRRAARRGAGLAAAAVISLAVIVPWLSSGLGNRAAPASQDAVTAATKEPGGRAGPSRAGVVRVGPGPTSLAVTDDGSIWVGHSGDNSVRRIDPVSDEVVETRRPVDAGRRTSLIATNGREIYTADATEAAVAEVDAEARGNAPAAGYPAGDLVYDDGSLWTAADHCGGGSGATSCVRRLYLSEGAVSGRRDTLEVGCCPITAVAVSRDAVWVATTGARGDAPGLIRLPKSGSGAPVTVALEEAPADLVLGSKVLWAALPRRRAVARLDIARPRAAPSLVPVPSSPVRLALGRGVLWTAGRDGRVVRIDTGSDEVAPPLEVGAMLADIAVSRGEAWVAAPARDVVYRIKP